MADITVNISRQTTTTTTAGFGVPLLLVNTAHTYEEYTSLAGVEGDFAKTTEVYAIAEDLFRAGTLRKMAIAGISYTEVNTVGSETLTQDSGNTYEFANDNINVNSITGLQDSGTNIPTSDISSIDYEAGTITFATSKTSVTVTGYTHNSSATGFTTLLNTLESENRDFYCILQEANKYTAQKEVSTWVNGKKKMHLIRTDLKGGEYPVELSSQTAGYYHATATEAADAIVAGLLLPKTPGSVSWANQVIANATANALTGTELANLKTERFNTIFRQYNRVITSNGYLQGDLFIDQLRSRHYMEALITENVAQIIIDNDKVAYDDTGIAQIASGVSKALDTATQNTIIRRKANGQGDYNVTTTAVADIPQSDIDSRTLTTLEFSYIEAGAIENATINGRIVQEV